MRKVTNISTTGDFTLAEKLNLRNGSNVQNINDLVTNKGDRVILGKIKRYAILQCKGHDDDKKEIQYEQLIMVTDDGKYFATLSEVFTDAFIDMYNDVESANAFDDVLFGVICGENEKKNKFLSCYVEDIPKDK